MPLSPVNLCPIYRHNLNCTTQFRHFATETSLGREGLNRAGTGARGTTVPHAVCRSHNSPAAQRGQFSSGCRLMGGPRGATGSVNYTPSESVVECEADAELPSQPMTFDT
jgi:hypothetical protein